MSSFHVYRIAIVSQIQFAFSITAACIAVHRNTFDYSTSLRRFSYNFQASIKRLINLLHLFAFFPVFLVSISLSTYRVLVDDFEILTENEYCQNLCVCLVFYLDINAISLLQQLILLS